MLTALRIQLTPTRDTKKFYKLDILYHTYMYAYDASQQSEKQLLSEALVIFLDHD